MIKLKTPLNLKGGLVEKGRTVALSPELEEKMVKSGCAEYCYPGETKEPALQPPKQQEDSKISDMNAKDAIDFAESLDDIMELNKLGMEETEGKNRATVVKAISERIAKLEASEEPDPDKGGSGDENNDSETTTGNGDSGENLNPQPNPADVIES